MANFELDASSPFEAKDTGETCTSKRGVGEFYFYVGEVGSGLVNTRAIINEGTRKRSLPR